MNVHRAPSIIAIVPARAGSRGLPRKNTLTLCGRPMLSYTVDALSESHLIEQSLVLTDDPVFARIAESFDLEVIPEPAEYAMEGSPVELGIDYAVRMLEEKYGWRPSIVVICEPNVPVRPSGILDEAIRALELSGAEVAYTLEPASHHHPEWAVELRDGRIYFPASSRQTFRQALAPRYHLTSAAYVYRRERLLTTTFCENSVGVVHAPGESIDIDTPFDFEFAEFLISRRTALLPH